MALVNYSDSETSDTEDTAISAPAPPAPKTAPSSKPSTFPKLPSTRTTTERRKIKVDLPALQPEHNQKGKDADETPPAKRAKTGGAFSGFNALLPAPKRSGQSAPKAGTSLKTSGEAAFSRNPAPTLEDEREGWDGEEGEKAKGVEEMKVVGKATRFKPLSVAAGRKKNVVKKGKVEGVEKGGAGGGLVDGNVLPAGEKKVEVEKEAAPAAVPVPPKPKRSLFSVPQAEEEAPPSAKIPTEYISETYHTTNPTDTLPDEYPEPSQQTAQPTLQTLAADLDLTSAQRRQLFGRNPNNSSISNNSNINIAHFDMNNEYAANEQLRQAGEVVEHRAVKAIAPGKHSLQQLVNNARTQREGLEDKWAAGRRERGGVGGGRGGG